MIDILDGESGSPRTLRQNNESYVNLSLSMTEQAQSNQLRLEADKLVFSYQQQLQDLNNDCITLRRVNHDLNGLLEAQRRVADRRFVEHQAKAQSRHAELKAKLTSVEDDQLKELTKILDSRIDVFFKEIINKYPQKMIPEKASDLQ